MDIEQTGRHTVKMFWTGLIATSLFLNCAAWSADAPLHPTKIAAAEAAGPIFSSPKAASFQSRTDGAVTNVDIGKSADGKFAAGLYKAGPSDSSYDSYSNDEFCYFLSGSVKLTSADGTVTDLKAGEAVLIPKGWKGRWTTTGYSKYYVIYK